MVTASPTSDKRFRDIMWSVLAFLILLLGCCLAILLVAFGLKKVEAFQPEVILSAVLVLGVVTLLGALANMVFLYYRSNDLSLNEPLGLPEGTVSAVIALMLILIFSITSIFLFTLIWEAETRGATSVDVSAADLAKIPPERIVSVSQNQGGQTFRVTTTVPHPASEEFAKQTLSVVGTLLVAIVGFYFGSKSTGGTRGPSGGPPPTGPPPSGGPPPTGPPPSTGGGTAGLGSTATPTSGQEYRPIRIPLRRRRHRS